MCRKVCLQYCVEGFKHQVSSLPKQSAHFPQTHAAPLSHTCGSCCSSNVPIQGQMTLLMRNSRMPRSWFHCGGT